MYHKNNKNQYTTIIKQKIKTGCNKSYVQSTLNKKNVLNKFIHNNHSIYLINHLFLKYNSGYYSFDAKNNLHINVENLILYL